MDRKNLQMINQIIVIVAMIDIYSAISIFNGSTTVVVLTGLMLLVASDRLRTSSRTTVAVQNVASLNFPAFQQSITTNNSNNNIANKEVVNICL